MENPKSENLKTAQAISIRLKRLISRTKPYTLLSSKISGLQQILSFRKDSCRKPDINRQSLM